MRRTLRASVVAVTMAVFAIAILAGVRIDAGQRAKSIRIIYTNDTMGYADPCG
ncbi:MAG: hypothetical protein M1133_12830 [Armatimonadetes bacterium]|nr:hypothetical protein [Armatimonadota bacterium]